MPEAWEREPIPRDRDMNVPSGLDSTKLESFEKAYLDAVADDLAWWRFWR
jgi:hypothetical protein